ncbi:hypothetical protein F5878DRAFT_672310 [Lentinula raphanica]|uniref:F-box domain-containing protein n=1 Tax=Lentinula raphanica TaxID=153919 RepID=A0AA38UGU2_9AGAR|nr:hypothetical protein F5878DRAFT_672310 [Lentinula raphanica]
MIYSSSSSMFIYGSSLSHPTSTAQYLPFDILSEIFQYLPDLNLNLAEELETDVISPKTGPYILRPEIYPWSITRVCSAWRTAAIYEPHLWSRVHLEVGQKQPSHGKVELLRLYLSRSRNCKLNVSLHCTWTERALDNAYLSLLFPTLGRWQFFSLHVLAKSLPVFWDLGNFPMLEILHLYVAHQAKTPPLNNINHIFQHAPRLHTIRYRHSDDRSVFVMPLDQLKVYQGPLSSIPADSGCDWISNLQWCAFAANGRQPEWALTEVTAPHMREFSIRERIQPVNTVAVLNILTLPSLEIFRVKASGRMRLSDAIVGLLERSMCLLTELCLDVPDLTAMYMYPILRRTPQVVKLRITSKKLLPDFVQGWVYDPKTHAKNPCILQHLESLDLGRCTFIPTAEITLLQMIQSRWEVPGKMTAEKYFSGPATNSITRLRTFQVPYKFQRTKRSQKKILRVWKEEGLDIQFGPGNQNRL